MPKTWRSCLVLILPFLLVGCVDLSAIADVVQPAEEQTSAQQSIRATPIASNAESTPTPEGREHGEIPLLFVSDRANTDTTDIYQMNADGSGLVRLTRDPASERDPAWSPDLRQMAFTSDRTGTYQIYLMSMDDYEINQLTDHPEGAISPVWSPDGAQIAFVEPTTDSNAVFIVSAEGDGSDHSLVVEVMSLANLAWSPMGDKIAFSALVEGQDKERDIFTYDLNDGRLTNLTNEIGDDDNPAWSPDGNSIAFQTDRGGDENVYVMRANGALQTPLTTDLKDDVEPSWSDDGRQIVFSSNRDGHFNIYLMSDSGSDQTILAPFPANDNQAQWPPSPIVRSGGELVYASGIFAQLRDLHLTNATGTVRSKLTESDTSDDTIPDWSPDGTRIVFSSTRDGNYDIYTMKADGSNWVKLTTNPGDDKHPAWSPDGKKIAFESRQSDDDWDVWIMDIDGSNLQNITADEGTNDGNPSWSPDGKQIVFSSNRRGDYDIYIVNADGSNSPTRLTDSTADEFHPDWSPDGALIAFRSTSPSSGKRRIKVASVDGLSSRDLFSSPGNDDTPAWSPDGQQIAFASDRPINNELTSDSIFRIYVYDLETGRIIQTTHGDRDGRYPAWRPN